MRSRSGKGSGPSELVPGAGEGAEARLSRLGGGWSLQAAFEAWEALRAGHASERAELQDERRRLEDQGRFLLGAVRAASAPTSPVEAPADEALAPAEALPTFLSQAEEKLADARRSLDEREAVLEKRIAEEDREFRQALEQRVARFAESARPSLVMWLRPVGSSRRILQLERVAPDESIVLLHVLASAIPSRYGFLFDDATDDLSLPPPPLYPDLGLTREETRPTADGLRRIVEDRGDVLPIKAFLPVFVPGAEGKRDFFRLLQRGAVMEVEIAEGETFRNLLTPEEAERFAGLLLRHKLAGRLELDIRA